MTRNVVSISKKCTPFHVPIEGIVHLELAVVPEGLPCLHVEGKNERLLCSCIISVNVDGKWHA